jgi:hypothetical protein
LLSSCHQFPIWWFLIKQKGVKNEKNKEVENSANIFQHRGVHGWHFGIVGFSSVGSMRPE